MAKTKKCLASALVLTIAISSLALTIIIPKALAQNGTTVSWLISSDTTWTQAGSPYTLTSPVAVNQGVTLKIDAGAIINLDGYYIRINGTLRAIGGANEKIILNGGQITVTTVSNGWSAQTNSGCIIENSIINQTTISCSNPIKIDNSIINSQITVDSSFISNNVVTGNINCQSAMPEPGQSNPPTDTSVISGNIVNGNINVGSVYLGADTAPSEACTVSNNTVYGSIISASPQGTPQIFNNTVTKGGIGCDGYGSIFDNYVYGCQAGISLYTMRVFGGNLPCYATVENNIVTGNSQGISISLTDVHGGLGQQYCPTIINNTVSKNPIGISLSGFGYNAAPTIKYNNLQSSSNYTFYLQESNNVDLSYNWWGTTDQNAINQSIYDFKDDFNLGMVTFMPFLTSPNLQSPSAINPVPTPTSTSNPSSALTSTPAASAATSPTANPTSSPDVPEFKALMILTLLISVFSVALSGVIFRHRKKSGNFD